MRVYIYPSFGMTGDLYYAYIVFGLCAKEPFELLLCLVRPFSR